MSGVYFCVEKETVSESDDRLLRSSIERIYQASVQNDYKHRFGIYSHIYAILNLLFRCHSTDGYSVSSSRNQFRLMEQILKYIQDNCRGDLHLNDLAEEFNLSTAYICRLFKKNLHAPFSRYLRDARLKEAHRRLLTSKQSVEEIAIDCGFATSNHLIELFKEKYGETPGKYRKT